MLQTPFLPVNNCLLYNNVYFIDGHYLFPNKLFACTLTLFQKYYIALKFKMKRVFLFNQNYAIENCCALCPMVDIKLETTETRFVFIM